MKKHIEAEKGELIIVSDEGHRAIIPAKDRKYFLDSLNGCDDCINKYIQQLPMMSNYAEDGSLVPDDGDPIKKETYEQWGDRIRKMSPNLDYTKDGDYNYRGAYEAGLEPVEVDNNGVKEYHLGSRNPKTGEILKYRSHPTFNQAISEDVKMGYVPYEKDGRIYTVDRKSKEYKDLYDSGKLLGYDRVNDLYIAPDLGGATIKATKPQWMKDKEALEKEYSKDWYIDNNLPKFSRSIGVSPNNMGGNQKGYDEYINNKLAESILKRNPNFDKDYSNNRLKTLSNYSQKELEIIKNSNLSYKVEPSIWSKFEQGLLSVGNAGSPVTFKNENLTQKEAKKEDNPLNILQPLSVPSKMVQSVYKKDYSLKDALKGKQNNAGIVEDIVTDPLNLVGAGLVGKLSKADKVIDATKVGSKVLNKTDDVVNRLKFEDFNNENEFFRIIVGDGAYDDILKSGKVRVKEPSDKIRLENVINLDRRGTTPFPSFSKGKPSLEYAQSNNNHYIIRTNDASIKPSTYGRHGKGSTMFPTDDTGKHLKELDASKVQVYKHVGNGEYELVNTAKPIVSSVDDASKQVPKQWQLEELPGLHLKSTMEGQSISKIIEPKTGLINIEQALGIIGKESGGANKVSLIRKGLGENIPKKMDYNEFRKVVQNQLIPLEKQFATHSSGYGIDRLGYGKYKTVINERGNPVLQPLKGKNLEPLENQTLILGNKSKFGRGSSAHGNPEETLGHIHFLRDAETPDVLTVTQIQSDAFQGTHRIMPKTQQEALEKVSKLKEEGIEVKSMFGDWKESSNSVLANYEKNLQLDEASAKNFTQKQLLDKNHQERYLHELVDYAGKRGDVNKIRVPTSETAAKVQGYEKITLTGDNTPGFVDLQEKISIAVRQGNQKEVDELMKIHDKILETPYKKYSNEHQTILKKYSEQPKTIKKLFGVEPKVVIDSKGNTWYEFEIPKKFKEGKGEIKAFQVIPPAIGSALYLQSQNKNKSEQ